MTATAVVGAQYGSEGKGKIVHLLAREFGTHVRTGGPNAGHTIYEGGVEFKMQTIPVGWTNPDALLVIGPGATFDLDNFANELALLEARGHRVSGRILIDRRAGVITQAHRALEGGHGRMDMAHGKIGSTGEGVGATRLARVARGVLIDPTSLPFMQAWEFPQLQPWLCEDVTRWYGGEVLLEGTQGFGLSLTTGEWPYVTSAATTAAQLASDAGYPVTGIDRVIAVVRAYPIRVAGNSGPLKDETTWSALGLEEEHTTVTKKVRRVGAFDLDMVRDAVRINGATEIAVTCLDQMFPETAGAESFEGLTHDAARWLDRLEHDCNVPVTYVGTGKHSGVDVDLSHDPSSRFLGH